MKTLRYRVEYALLLCGVWLAQKLSLEAAQALGRWLGRVGYALGVARRTAEGNLARALPELSAGERSRIARRAYEQFGTTMLELCRFPCSRPSEIASYFEFENLEVMDRLKAQGRGAVCLSAHYGNWEWMGAALIAQGYPLTFMIGRQSNPFTDKLLQRYRQAAGIPCVRIHALRDVLRALKQGRFVAVLSDQDGDRFGRFATFFGQIVSTHYFWEAVALRAKAAFIFGVSQRLGPKRHRVEIKDLPDPPPDFSEAQASAFRLQVYNDFLEQAVRQDPSQWLWMHARWCSLPEHRLAGEERRRAEAGEFRYDTQRQAWRRACDGEVVELSTWRP